MLCIDLTVQVYIVTWRSQVSLEPAKSSIGPLGEAK